MTKIITFAGGLLALWMIVLVTIIAICDLSFILLIPGFIVFLGYLGLCFFLNSVPPEKTGMIAFGGKAVSPVDGGYALVLFPFFELWLETRRVQYIFSPGEHAHSEKSVTCQLRPVQFTGKNDSKDPYEKQVTTTPTLTIVVEVVNAEEFFENAEDHIGAADLLCEEVNGVLLEQVKGKTLREFLDHLRAIENHITNHIKDGVTGLGLRIISAGHHASIQIISVGVPQEVVNAEKEAMASVAKVPGIQAEGEADAARAKAAASGIEATKKAEAAGELALADKEKELIVIYTKQLGKKGAAQVLAGKEMAEGLPRGAQTIIIGNSDGAKPMIDITPSKTEKPQTKEKPKK